MKGNDISRYFLGFGLITLVVVVAAYLSYHQPKPLAVNGKVKQREAAAPLPPAATKLKDSIVAFGMSFLGTPYTASGCSKDGFDCSGFVYFVFQHYKIDVPRSSAGFEHFGKEIPVENVEKGDVLVFLSPTQHVIGHIGIVSTANGATSSFIHASSGREMKVIISSLATEGYKRRFVKAIRVL